MTVEQFISEETDLLISLLCLGGVKLSVPLSDDNQPRLRIGSLELSQREINKVTVYSRELHLFSDRLHDIGFRLTKSSASTSEFELAPSDEIEIKSGDLIQLKVDVMDGTAGSICFVYSAYKGFVYLITENGTNINGVKLSHIKDRSVIVKRQVYSYKYRGDDELHQDYEYGVFDKAFEV